MGALPSIIASRLAKAAKAAGPAITVADGEYSGTLALELALHAIARGDADQAVVAVVDTAGSPLSVYRRDDDSHSQQAVDTGLCCILQDYDSALASNQPILAKIEVEVESTSTGEVDKRPEFGAAASLSSYIQQLSSAKGQFSLRVSADFTTIVDHVALCAADQPQSASQTLVTGAAAMLRYLSSRKAHPEAAAPQARGPANGQLSEALLAAFQDSNAAAAAAHECFLQMTQDSLRGQVELLTKLSLDPQEAPPLDGADHLPRDFAARVAQRDREALFILSSVVS